MSATTMSERPIIFSAPMVRAILDGRKTQTRRVMNPQPVPDPHATGKHWWECAAVRSMVEVEDWMQDPRDPSQCYFFCPYGRPSDRLWVREAWRCHGGREYEYQRNRNAVIYRADDDGSTRYDRTHDWRNALFMPRWASRLLLEVVSVRVERVQEITPHDVIDEGFDDPSWWREFRNSDGRELIREDSALIAFEDTWNDLNAKRGYGWASNPWVWVIEFRRVEGGAT